MVFEWSSTRQIICLPSAHFDWLPWQQKTQNAKKKKKKKKKKQKKMSLKIISSQTIWNIGLRMFRNIVYICH